MPPSVCRSRSRSVAIDTSPVLVLRPGHRRGDGTHPHAAIFSFSTFIIFP